MSPISNYSALLSCLPFIGSPLIGTYNLYNVMSEYQEEVKKSEEATKQLEESLLLLKIAASPLRMLAVSLTMTTQEIETDNAKTSQLNKELTTLSEKLSNNLRKLKDDMEDNMRLYSICAIAGDLLTLALSVTGVVFSLFTFSPLVFWGAVAFPCFDIGLKSMVWYQAVSSPSAIPLTA